MLRLKATTLQTVSKYRDARLALPSIELTLKTVKFTVERESVLFVFFIEIRPLIIKKDARQKL